MTTSRAVRACERCGRTLSSYNHGVLCGSCARESSTPSALDELHEEWLPRSHTTVTLNPAASGDALRAYRLAAGLSQAALASMLGMTQQNLSQIERGRTPSLDQRRRMIEVLGLAPEDLGLASRPNPELDVSADHAVAESRARWRAERRWLNQHRNDLARLAVELYPPEWRVPNTPLLAHPGWIMSDPVDLRSIALELDESPCTTVIDGSEPATMAVRPLRAPNVPFDRYTAAIKHLDPPRLFESRPSYRMLDANFVDRRITFGMAAYFDKLDVSEALGHETAIASMHRTGAHSATRLHDALPFRDLIVDPFATHTRAIIPAITTLTIRLRRYPEHPTFLLHWRDPARVATAGGTYDVIPAGEFQPSSIALWDRRSDFDLWRNIVREYAEELLGAPEHDGTRSVPIDYEAWPLYSELEAAFAAGGISAHLLGLGLDALTLAATILTVVVIDDDVFERSFGEVVRDNDEGQIVSAGANTAAQGIPFTQETVHRLLTSEPMASPGAACLALAWRHRAKLQGL